jgi:hypothetical protein
MISQESPDARFFAEAIVREVVLMVSILNRRSPNAQEKSVIQITLRPGCDLDHMSAIHATVIIPAISRNGHNRSLRTTGSGIPDPYVHNATDTSPATPPPRSEAGSGRRTWVDGGG